jgi:SAM-dependent methyltransferase
MSATPERNGHARRPTYEPGSPPETFIVPLLRERIEEAIRAHAPAGAAPRRVLDVGCGRQPFRPLLASPTSTYVGLDVQQSPECTVDVVAAVDGPLPADLLALAPFDFILCTEVLEHVADWKAAFVNLARLLRAGGKVLITCPHFYHLHEEPYDFWRPTLHALNHFARAEGLRVVHQEAAGDAWDLLGTLLASCHATPHSRRLLDRVQARAVHWLKRLAFGLLRRRWPQRLARLQGPVYLSNVVVLEKP